MKIPESSYRDSVLGLLRYHTVGWPIVRTEFTTHSETYGSMRLGPEDEISFEEASSLTERDCVGMLGNDFMMPRGAWLPTNDTDRNDGWKASFGRDIPIPKILFSCHETGGGLLDWVGKTLVLAASGTPKYKRACSGLMVADKQLYPVDSSVVLNILRGVELTSPTQDHFSSSSPETGTFMLGNWRSGAFLQIFRLSSLPETEGNLFYCSYPRITCSTGPLWEATGCSRARSGTTGAARWLSLRTLT